MSGFESPVRNANASPNARTRVHFPGLNGLRAIAAFIVILSHIDLFLPLFHLKRFGYEGTGWDTYAVTLFFVLSGFLITYLLLTEKKDTGSISIKKFYIRRILRIWPLYYLVIILALIIGFFVSSIGFDSLQSYAKLIFYVFLLPNVAYAGDLSIKVLSPLWSVGVEEQFYAIWPAIVKKTTSAKQSLITVMAIYLSIKLISRFSGSQFFYYLVGNTRIDCMAMGGLGSVFLLEDSKILKWVYNPVAQVLAWSIFVYSTLFKPLHVYSFLDQELYSIIFLIMILNVGTNKRTLVNLENRFFDFFGKISYGLYMFHMLVIFILSSFYFKSYFPIYAFTILITIIISFISYHMLEIKFIRKKEAYSNILSRESIDVNG